MHDETDNLAGFVRAVHSQPCDAVPFFSSLFHHLFFRLSSRAFKKDAARISKKTPQRLLKARAKCVSEEVNEAVAHLLPPPVSRGCTNVGA